MTAATHQLDDPHLFRVLVETSADGMVVLIEGRITYINAAAERLLCRSREELLGEMMGIPVIPGEIAEIDLVVPGTPPTIRIAEMRSVSFMWQQQPAILAALRDITPRKQAEEALRLLSESSRELSRSLDRNTVLNSVADLVMGHFGQGCIVELCNHESIPQVELIAHLDSHIAEQWSQAAQNLPCETDAAATDNAVSSAWRFGTPFPFAWLDLPLVVQGQTIGRLTIVRGPEHGFFQPEDRPLLADFAHRVAASLEHCRLYEEIQGRHRHQAEFVAMLGHELRNPLNAIRQSIELAERMPNSPLAWAVIDRQSKHLHRLVNDLLDMTRITHGKIELLQDRVDLVMVLNGVRETCTPYLSDKAQRLELQGCENSCFVIGDTLRLEQAIGNLVHNASKFTPIRGEIVLRIESAESVWRILVIDQGVGIAPELLPHIFELFRMGPQSSDRAGGGLGIGLTLCRRLIERHNGTINVRATMPPPGTTFIVELPKCDDLPVELLGNIQSQEPKVQKRILLVEDNADSRAMLQQLIGYWGHEIEAMGNGIEGLDWAIRQWPDVLLTDISLPGCDGHEIAQRIRRHERQMENLPRMTLIGISGLCQPEDEQRAAASGFDHYLIKPIDLTQLEALLR